MIAAIDTSSFVAYLKGESGKDIQAVDHALELGCVMLPPVVLTELLSDAKLPKQIVTFFKQIPLLDITPGYWERAARLRSKVLAKGFKARLADCLIAQSCIDNNASLITRDKDFRHYVKAGKLRLD